MGELSEGGWREPGRSSPGKAAAMPQGQLLEFSGDQQRGPAHLHCSPSTPHRTYICSSIHPPTCGGETRRGTRKGYRKNWLTQPWGRQAGVPGELVLQLEPEGHLEAEFSPFPGLSLFELKVFD